MKGLSDRYVLADAESAAWDDAQFEAEAGDRLHKEAARYRWLRDSGRVFLRDGADDSGWLPTLGADLDDEIDDLLT